MLGGHEKYLVLSSIRHTDIPHKGVPVWNTFGHLPIVLLIPIDVAVERTNWHSDKTIVVVVGGGAAGVAMENALLGHIHFFEDIIWD